MRGISRWFKKWDCKIDGHHYQHVFEGQLPDGIDSYKGPVKMHTIDKYLFTICKYCGNKIRRND